METDYLSVRTVGRIVHSHNYKSYRPIIFNIRFPMTIDIIQHENFKIHHITHCNRNTSFLRKCPSNLHRQNQYSNLLLLQHHQAYDDIDSDNCQQHILHSTDNNTPSSAR